MCSMLAECQFPEHWREANVPSVNSSRRIALLSSYQRLLNINVPCDCRMKTDCFGWLKGRFTGSQVESQTQKNARKSVCGTHKYAKFARWSMQLNCRQAGRLPRVLNCPILYLIHWALTLLLPLLSHGDGWSRQSLIFFPSPPDRAKTLPTAGAFFPPTNLLRTVEPSHSRSPFPERFSHSN